ncbi:DUF551 domain-containing protein [Cronobacter sakazakii]|uniref:DUF551 domain-containing protein n=1 Tax=Cronobacter sakazakii TaxID=28141 RepID=UPI002A75ECD8|nr:DUF551 domain-containing protein [Cronobacter sakazakii]
MSEISEEALAAACAEKVKQLEFSVKQSALDSVRQELETELAIARVALLALRERAEPVGEVVDQPDGLVMDGTVHLGGSGTHRAIKGLNKMKRMPLGTKFYTAPPAPVAAGWIACSERMPEREYVLAADFSGAYYLPSLPNTQVGIYADWFEDGKPSWDDGDGNDLHLKQVTHWMPLPEAPTNN